MIPQSNPKANYVSHREGIDSAIRRVLESGWFILGQEVKAFEQEIAAYFGAAHCVSVASGTDAIELALRACGIGAGHIVFTVSHTAVATVVAIERAGATPVLVDIDPATYTMDPTSLDAAIASALQKGKSLAAVPKAILPVHLYGQACDLEAILSIAKRFDMTVIEDCAQCHGATLNGKKLGTFGKAAAFSFYPTKNLGALGDGGAIVTSDSDVAEKLRSLREYGWRERYVSSTTGVNSRLDELQAAILRPKLVWLDQDNARRREIAARYDRELDRGRLTLPLVRSGCEHVYHQYVVRAKSENGSRDDLRQYLKNQGVGTLVHYPVAVHDQPAYRGRLFQATSLDHTEQAAREIVSLPMYPELTHDQVANVCNAINSWPVLEPLKQ
jgi:dTDP-4-amino-4,6-dideoxygalactose transaminase